ncbi:MAG TPA: hypothetical protein ACQGQH_08010 [Xylella sp.]
MYWPAGSVLGGSGILDHHGRDVLLGQQVETAQGDGVRQHLGGHCAADLVGGRAVQRQAQVDRDQLFERASELALLGLDQLQVGQALAAGGFLVFQGLHRERDFKLGHVAYVVQALWLAGDVAGADVYAPLSREVRHGQSPLRAVG